MEKMEHDNVSMVSTMTRRGAAINKHCTTLPCTGKLISGTNWS
jgi:hypothetical protein